MTAPGSWSRYSLEVRAKLSAERQDHGHWPRQWVLFGPRVVPLEVFLLSQARSHQSFDKARKRWLERIQVLERGIRRRNASMAEADEYIKALKVRCGLPPTGLTNLTDSQSVPHKEAI
jgi:hypothetical protein